MATEMEAKFRLDDVQAMRMRLRALGGELLGAVLEHNVYYDTAEQRLRQEDCGLRIRTTQTADGQREAILTYKGARKPGPLKVRQEEESHVEAESAGTILEALGFRPYLSFQKRRESYLLAGAKVEIDELPQLGHFLEIEGPDEATIQAVRELLQLGNTPILKHAYAAIIARHLFQSNQPERRLHFADSTSGGKRMTDHRC